MPCEPPVVSGGDVSLPLNSGAPVTSRWLLPPNLTARLSRSARQAVLSCVCAVDAGCREIALSPSSNVYRRGGNVPCADSSLPSPALGERRCERAGCRAVRTARSWRGIVPVMHLAREGRMTVTIGRRELLAALGGAAAAWPLAVARAAGGDADDWIHEWYLARPYCAAVKSAFL